MLRACLMTVLILLGAFPAAAQDVDTTALNDVLNTYADLEETAIVLHVRTGENDWTGVRGFASLETETPARSDDLFRIGSITKPLVATTVLALVDEGELSLDDPIARYLPDDIVNNVANADIATVRQMLQMTSGIVSYTDTDDFDSRVQTSPAQWWTPERTLQSIYSESADFAPGTDYYYSNSNYNLAQILIEQITGMSLAEALDMYIFAPAGMGSCYLETEATFAQDIVRGYSDFGDGLDDVTAYNDGVGMGDGGVICTAADLAKFPTTLYNTDLFISDGMLDEMLNTVDDGDGGQYGLGIGYDETCYGMELAHDGATSGFQANMVYLVDDDVTLIVLVNNFDVDWLADITADAQAAVLGAC